jgi:SAM-dependent methyltransferase
MQSDLLELHGELEESHWWFVGRRRIMRALIRRVLPPSRSETIVDVGCGTGANVASMADEYSCIGVDTSGLAIAMAKERYPGVQFRHGHAPEVLGDEARTAAMFLSMDVLEHIEDDFLAFSSLFAVAKPGALFYINVPADRALWSGHDEAFGHLRRYDPVRLRALWEGLPASTLLLSYFNARLYPIVRAMRTLSSWRDAPFGKHGTDLREPPAPMNRAVTAVFEGEKRRLTRVVEGRARPYSFGSSMVAIVRREAGAARPRNKPPGLDARFAKLAARSRV